MTSRRETIITALMDAISSNVTASILLMGQEASDYRLIPDDMPAVVVEKRSDSAKAENDNAVRVLEIAISIYTAGSDRDTEADALAMTLLSTVLAVANDVPGVRIREGATQWESIESGVPILRTSTAYTLSYKTKTNLL